jgi:acyl carrier protein
VWFDGVCAVEEVQLSIEARVKSVLSKNLLVDIELLHKDAKLVEDLGASSLDRCEMFMTLEERFEIELTQQEQDRVIAVGDAIELVREKVCSPPTRRPKQARG